MILGPIFGFQPHLSSTRLVWQSVGGQELGPSANVMGNSCNVVGSHIFGGPHKRRTNNTTANDIASRNELAKSVSGWFVRRDGKFYSLYPPQGRQKATVWLALPTA